jgi:hypothetical protein
MTAMAVPRQSSPVRSPSNIGITSSATPSSATQSWTARARFRNETDGAPPRGNSLKKTPRYQTSKRASKARRLRITSALRVERAEIAPVLFIAPVFGSTNAALFPKLLYPFNDPKIAHRAIAECFQGFRVCGAVVSSSRLFQARKFSNDGTLLKPMLPGYRGIAACKDTGPKRHYCGKRKLRVGGKLFGIRN